jgi:UDP-N-acetyl-2-amino-2-deoxyglucuronate dehydrogenase
MTFRVGLLGTGNISDTHARAAREVPGVEIVAYYGRSAETAERLASKYGAGGAAYSVIERFLNHRPMDAVLVGTPSGLHAEHGIAAARHGLHVLIEKPLDVTTERADALVAECERAGVTLGVFFQDRTAPDLIWLRRAITSGSLGEVFLASARVKWYRAPEYYASSRWRGTWALDGGGALMNQGVHTVDLLLWLLGDVRRVHGATRTALHDIEVEDTAVADLEFVSGAIGTLEVTTSAYPGFARRVELTGTLGTIAVEHDRVASVDLREAPSEPPPRDDGSANASAKSHVVADPRGHRRVLEDFIHAVRTGGRPLCDGRDGRRSVELVEAIYRSARSGSAITLGENHRSAVAPEVLG